MRQLVVDKSAYYTRAALLEDGKLADFRIEKNEAGSLVGNIYKGRVSDVIPGMDAAFVDIGLEKNAYLSKLDMLKAGKRGRREDRIGDLLKTGDEVLVQVVKDEAGTKGAKVSMRIGLTGDYMVLMPQDPHIGVSRQIEDADETERLKAWLKAHLDPSFGGILRTSSKGQSSAKLEADLDKLLDRFKYIERYRVLGKTPMCVDAGDSFITTVLRDALKRKLDKVTVNDQSIYSQIKAFVEAEALGGGTVIEHYTQSQPVFEAYLVEQALKVCFDRRIDLPSGAYLFVDETEALTVIDVNSGQHTGKASMDMTAYKVNLEAARMIAKLIKIRALSGIILIDFIDMTDLALKEKLVQKMRKFVLADRNRVTIHGLTTLGILEMTRRKSVESVLEKTSIECAHCAASGYVKNSEYMLDALVRELAYYRGHTDASAVLYAIPEHVHTYILKNRSQVHAYTEKTGFKVFYLLSEQKQFQRLRADEQEKIEDFAKKTGNSKLYHI